MKDMKYTLIGLDKDVWRMVTKDLDTITQYTESTTSTTKSNYMLLEEEKSSVIKQYMRIP